MANSREWSTTDDLYILRNYDTKTLNEIGEHLGVSRDAVWGRLNRLRKWFTKWVKDGKPRAGDQGSGSPTKPAASMQDVMRGKPSVSWDKSKQNQAVNIISDTVRTEEQALEAAGVDTSKWEVDRCVINKWDGFAKLEKSAIDGDARKGHRSQVGVVELWQVKLFLKRKAGMSQVEFRDRLLADMKGYSPKYKPVKHPHVAGNERRYMLEPAIVDLHCGKYAWEAETGEPYDMEEAQVLCMEAVEHFIAENAHRNISEIVLPVGNDHIHIDTHLNTTTKGTPQDHDGRWQQSFLMAKDLTIQMIDRFREVAPVKVRIVGGNHDEQRMFFLGEVLESHYRLDDVVEVDNSVRERKFHLFGNCLLGFTHGHNVPAKELPLNMATEAKELWAQAKFYEWHCGHLHKRAKTEYITTDTYGTVVVRILPSLAAQDAWHYKKAYLGLRAAECYLWDYEAGYAGHVCYNVDPQRYAKG